MLQSKPCSQFIAAEISGGNLNKVLLHGQAHRQEKRSIASRSVAHAHIALGDLQIDQASLQIEIHHLCRAASPGRMQVGIMSGRYAYAPNSEPFWGIEQSLSLLIGEGAGPVVAELWRTHVSYGVVNGQAPFTASEVEQMREKREFLLEH